MIDYKMTMTDYLKHPAIGSSMLKNILMSPADYKAALSQRNISTAAMSLGTAIHSAILEPTKFLNEYILQPENWGPKNKGDGFKKWKEFKETAKNVGKTPLAFEDSEFIKKVLHASQNHKPLQEVLAGGKSEVTAFAKIGDTELKARCDLLTKDNFIYDLKTTSKPIDDESLSRTIFNFGYHFQATHHTAVFKAAGIDVSGWGWIFVSTQTPAVHIVMRTASKELLAAGKQDWDYAKDRLNNCTKFDKWETHTDEVSEIGLPGYALKDYD